jgi:hypothetical protein
MKTTGKSTTSIAKSAKTSAVMSGYKMERAKFEETLDVTIQCSLIQHGIQTDGRGVRAVKIFTRQTLVAMSLDRILPLAQTRSKSAYTVWDVCSIASSTPNLLEGYVMLFYAGLEPVNPSEAEFRFLLGQYHRSREWRDIRGRTNPNDTEIPLFNAGLSEQMTRLKTHPFFRELSDVQRGKVNKGQETYLSKAEIEQRAPVVGNYRTFYQLLSNLVHPLPLSIERIDNDRGRGEMTSPDIHYCVMCISLATKFLAASTIGVADLFPTHFAGKLAGPLNKIRPYMDSA